MLGRVAFQPDLSDLPEPRSSGSPPALDPAGRAALFSTLLSRVSARALRRLRPASEEPQSRGVAQLGRAHGSGP
jgi:hypothetical protein